MTITLGEVEAAIVTFFGAFIGYLLTAAQAISNLDIEHAALVGASAALVVLGYSAVTQGVGSQGSATAAPTTGATPPPH